MAYKLGGMDDWDPEAPEPPVSEQIALMKVSFAGNYFYDTGIYLPKLALLAFYYRLIPPTMPSLRKALYAVTGITVLFACTTCMVDTFWCGRKVSVNWDLEGTCSSFESNEITIIDWSLNFTADLLGALYPYAFQNVFLLVANTDYSLLPSFPDVEGPSSQQKVPTRLDRHLFAWAHHSSHQRQPLCHTTSYRRRMDQCLYVKTVQNQRHETCKADLRQMSCPWPNWLLLSLWCACPHSSHSSTKSR
jgi:hypothetical protein